MRADAPTRMRHLGVPIVIASALLAVAISAGCRTAGVGAKGDPDPALKAAVGSAEAAEIAALPEGPGKALVTERCLLCHSAALISQQRKDAAAWGRTVTQMRTWGTPIQDADQTAVVAYLAEHFGPGGVRR
jgi:cytochrome c5